MARAPHKSLLNAMFRVYAPSGKIAVRQANFDAMKAQAENLDLGETKVMLKAMKIMPQWIRPDIVAFLFMVAAGSDAGTMEGVDLAKLLSKDEWPDFVVRLALYVFSEDGVGGKQGHRATLPTPEDQVQAFMALLHAAAQEHKDFKTYFAPAVAGTALPTPRPVAGVVSPSALSPRRPPSLALTSPLGTASLPEKAGVDAGSPPSARSTSRGAVPLRGEMLPQTAPPDPGIFQHEEVYKNCTLFSQTKHISVFLLRLCYPNKTCFFLLLFSSYLCYMLLNSCNGYWVGRGGASPAQGIAQRLVSGLCPFGQNRHAPWEL